MRDKSNDKWLIFLIVFMIVVFGVAGQIASTTGPDARTLNCHTDAECEGVE